MRVKFAKRWKSKFARFIKSYGVESLAVKLDVRPPRSSTGSAVGLSSPHSRRDYPASCRERGATLTMDAIYVHARQIQEVAFSEQVQY